MKTQFSFLDYIAHMTRMSTVFSMVVVILGIVSGIGFDGFQSLFIGMFGVVFGLIMGLTLSLMLSLVAFIFFSPENIFDQRFQIVSFAIIAIFNIMLFSIFYNLLAENYPVTIWEIGLVVVTSLVIMSAHRLASQDLVTTVEKRKEKQI